MAATQGRISNGRLLINVVTGGDPQQNKGDGINLPHAERYEITDEFLGIYRALLRGETVRHKGKHFEISDGRVLYPSVQKPYPSLYFGGSSEEGFRAGAKHIDKYLVWGEPTPQVAEKVAEKVAVMRRHAETEGREVTFGISLHVIVRETMVEARAAADRLISRLDDATIAEAQKVVTRMDSVGQARMSALHGGRRDKLAISPNLWTGVGLVRGGAGTARVGDPDTVAERIDKYPRVSTANFIFSGYPLPEEAYSFGGLVLPHLPLAHPIPRHDLRVNTGPFGETVAGDHKPRLQAAQ